MPRETVLVTGPTGFIGRPLCRALQEARVTVRGAARRTDSLRRAYDTVEWRVVGEVGPETDWTEALAGVEVVVHLAARAHVMRERGGDPLSEYRRVNGLGTRRLAEAAAAAGVRRLVLVSSLKVNGEATDGRPYADSDPPNPQDAYALSKWEAEQALQQVAGASSLEWVVMRPPLVYGPGVKGNLLGLVKAIDRGLPLPLARVRNRRSLIGLSNLVDILVLCARHPAAAGQILLVADGEDVSTPDLVRRLARAIGRPARLWPCPAGLLRTAARGLGRGAAIERLCGSLTVDSQKARALLSWTPPLSMDEELDRLGRWWRSRAGRGRQA